MFKFFILFLNIRFSYQLNVNLFNHWNCIGIIDKIDFTKPYVINIGDLPLVVWKDNVKNKLFSTVNICKHMGSKLNNALITDQGCLQCQYHGFEYGEKDCFGTVIEHEGKLFWSYDPILKHPFKIPFYNNNKYYKQFIEIDMECSLPDSIYNTMDLRHPEYVHNKIVGFGSTVPPTNIKYYNYTDRVGLSFDYSSNELIQKITKNTKVTHNFHMFIFPTFSWSRVIFDENKHLIIGINLLPLGPKKTRWYITVCTNHYKTNIEQQFLRGAASTILGQDFIQMKNQHPDDVLKKEILFNHVFEDEEVIIHLKNIMKDYKYIDVNICANLYKHYKKSILE
jgi:phenylpropionate dioxygenase-like ring-hydroxylating dioxygenase large terminal subunit